VHKGTHHSEESKIKIRYSKDGWPPERLELLRRYYPSKTPWELHAIFPDKSIQAIRVAASKYGIQKTQDTMARIARELGQRKQGPNNSQWKGGRWAWDGHHYGPDWSRQRRLAKQRDNHTCQICHAKLHRKSPRLHCHHIIPFADFGWIPSENDNYKLANQLNNLISLCDSCHLKVEHGSIPLQLPLTFAVSW